MGLPRDPTTRDLAGQPDAHGAEDRLHYGARAIALRVFGNDSDEHVRIIYRWQNELNPALRPAFLTKVGRRLAAWESAIQRHACIPAE